ncbi:hypothetical protein CHS0354_009309 [Potamilus streckersoni]|uniref:TROVE domain-containing protein n=1 Tax=Potamilus streckersoni TaxID=2493646 RepID=A0AAE0SNT9_9BIVA|nr:hypothetical protein CHS0354_009309 [Potamilus streckersoni]
MSSVQEEVGPTNQRDPQLQETGRLPNQREPEYHNIHGPQDQICNEYGGYTFRLSPVRRLERYLILGTEGGTVYRDEAVLEMDNIESLTEMINNKRGTEAVKKIRDVSVNRRCAKQKYVIHSLAICARSRDPETQKAAYEILPEVCRIPSDLFLFLNFCKENSTGSGWGRAHRRAISNWYVHVYQNRNPLGLAYLVTKYWARYNFTHRDTLRLAHISSDDPTLQLILRYIAKEHGRGVINENISDDPSAAEVQAFLEACQKARKTDKVDELCYLIRQHNLAREHVNTDMLKCKDVWEALLEKMPMEAMLRNLRNMGSLKMFAANSKAEDIVIQRLNEIRSVDMERVEAIQDDEEPMCPRSAHSHPFRILQALTEYQRGSSTRHNQYHEPNMRIVGALENAFFRSFSQIEPTHKKFCLAVDLSRSMEKRVHGSQCITCAKAAALQMLTIAKVEENYEIIGFSTQNRNLAITPDMNIDDIMNVMRSTGNYEGLDCAYPMKWAMENKKQDIDVFIIYTNNDTYCGSVHASEALRQYRIYSNNPYVKLVVCAMNSNGFSLAKDEYMLDVVGFDAHTPSIIADFCRMG